MRMIHLAKESGQSLLEIAMGIGVTLIVVTGITITTIVGLRNSQFAQNQTQATKFAQEALEKVRAVRDRNGIIYSSSIGVTNWGQFTWGAYCYPSCYVQLGLLDNNDNPTSCQSFSTTNTPTLTPCLIYPGIAEALLSNKFTRTITMVDCNSGPSTDCPAGKKVTATVFWTDAGGAHQSNLVTVLNDP